MATASASPGNSEMSLRLEAFAATIGFEITPDPCCVCAAWPGAVRLTTGEGGLTQPERVSALRAMSVVARLSRSLPRRKPVREESGKWVIGPGSFSDGALRKGA